MVFRGDVSTTDKVRDIQTDSSNFQYSYQTRKEKKILKKKTLIFT